MTRERVLLDYGHPDGPMIVDIEPGVSAVRIPPNAKGPPKDILGARFVRTARVDPDMGRLSFPVFQIQREPRAKK